MLFLRGERTRPAENRRYSFASVLPRRQADGQARSQGSASRERGTFRPIWVAPRDAKRPLARGSVLARGRVSPAAGPVPQGHGPDVRCFLHDTSEIVPRLPAKTRSFSVVSAPYISMCAKNSLWTYVNPRPDLRAVEPVLASVSNTYCRSFSDSLSFQ